MRKYALLCAVLALHAGASFAKDWNEIRLASEGAYPPSTSSHPTEACKGSISTSATPCAMN